MSSSFLFVTDLDNTLVGDDQATVILNQHLNNHRLTYGTKIVYSTGRSLSSYRQLRQQKQLLDPDALITSVGTEIYYQNSETPDPGWSKIISPKWNRSTIIETTAKIPQLKPQNDTEQRPYKISYFLTPENAKNILPKLQTKLQPIEINLIYSSNKDLDIIPKTANKGLAMQYLRAAWQIEPKQTVVCGDSGNDIAMFSVGQERGIIVGNAQPELLNWHQTNPSPNHYLAKKTYASGILEGLQHFKYLPN